MNPAPNLRVHSTSPRLLTLERTYGAWAEHFQVCSTCNSTEWYDPDVDRLCPSGQKLLANWKATAMATPVNAADIYGA